ncbi:MAG: DUF5995 family protein [Myxococcota bacterium]
MHGIDAVIDRLDAEAIRTARCGQPDGIFAALYRQMTLRVRQGIHEGWFDDGARMERFDVLFAQRYFDAQAGWLRHAPITESWRLAFRAHQRRDLLAVQHMLLGVNAHINLDLPISAARTVRPEEIDALRDDFERINDLIQTLLDEAQGVINAHSPGMARLDRWGGPLDEWMAGFGIRQMRAMAWKEAVRFSQRRCDVATLDERAAGFARRLTQPPWPVQVLLDRIRVEETPHVAEMIRQLNRLSLPGAPPGRR